MMCSITSKAQDYNLTSTRNLQLLKTPFKDSNSFEFYKGRTAYFHSINMDKNPYIGKAAIDWDKGYKSAKKEWESWKYKIYKKEN